MHSSCALTLLRPRYTYDGNFVDPSTQITGFSAFYPNQVLDKIDKLPQVSNASTGSGLTLHFETDSSNQARRTFNRCEAASCTCNTRLNPMRAMHLMRVCESQLIRVTLLLRTGELFKGFRGFFFTPMDARNVLAVRDMIRVDGTTESEYDTKFEVFLRVPSLLPLLQSFLVTPTLLPLHLQVFSAASKLVAGVNFQEVFVCPIGALPFNITQVQKSRFICALPFHPISTHQLPRKNPGAAKARWRPSQSSPISRSLTSKCPLPAGAAPFCTAVSRLASSQAFVHADDCRCTSVCINSFVSTHPPPGHRNLQRCCSPTPPQTRPQMAPRPMSSTTSFHCWKHRERALGSATTISLPSLLKDCWGWVNAYYARVHLTLTNLTCAMPAYACDCS